MKQFKILTGPFKGIYSATAPYLVPNGMLPYSENFRYHQGVMESIAEFTYHSDLLSGTSTITDPVLYMKNILRRDGTNIGVLITTKAVYSGALDNWVKISGSSTWGNAGPITEVSVAHLITPTDEKILIVNNSDPGIFWWDGYGATLLHQDVTPTTIGPPASGIYYDKIRFLLPFKNRLLFANMTQAASGNRSSNVVGYSGSFGPFDFEFIDGAGDNVLSDTFGPITSINRIGDYVAVFQPRSITLVQYVAGTFIFLWKTENSNVGCISAAGVQALPGGNVLAFPARDGVYIFNGQTTKKISNQIDDIYASRVNFDDTLTEATNISSVLMQNKNEYWIIFDNEFVLAWNYLEDTWAPYLLHDSNGDSLNLTAFAQGYNLYGGMKIDDLVGKIDDLVGKIDDFAGSVAKAAPIATGGGKVYLTEMTVVETGKIVWPVFRSPYPTTITRIVFEASVASDTTILASLSSDGGKTFLNSKEITIKAPEDVPQVATFGIAPVSSKAYWNIITTGLAFQLVITVKGQPPIKFYSVIFEVTQASDKEEEEKTPDEGETLTDTTSFFGTGGSGIWDS